MESDDKQFFSLLISRFEQNEANIKSISSDIKRLAEVINGKLERFDTKLDKIISERNVICQANDARIDEVEKSCVEIKTKLGEQEKTSKRKFGVYSIIMAFLAAMLSALLSIFFTK